MLKVTNPKATAEQFAQIYMARSKDLLTMQVARTSDDKKAQLSLRNTLTMFQKALGDAVAGGSLMRRVATLSNPQLATVTLAPDAKPGEYQFHVERLATANQQAIDLPPAIDARDAGRLTIKVGDDVEVVVDIASADKDADGKVSAQELARAINTDRSTNGAVRAAIVGDKLVLTAARTGAQSRIAFATDTLTDPALAVAFEGARETVKAQDARIILGERQSGLAIEQASNTLDSIDGVSIAFNQAGASGSVSVAVDNAGTVDGVKAFADAYNALMRSIADLTRAGDAARGDPGGPFSADAGVRALVGQIKAALRQRVEGLNLYDLGIDTDRYGMLNVNASSLDATLKTNAAALDEFFGDATRGLAGNLTRVLDRWLDAASGQLKRREESIDASEKSIVARQADWDRRHASVLERYTKEFTQLQIMQQKMESTLEQLKALFSTNKD
ncbi:flagellar filament capping protein FliD [Burkholderia sp. AW33-5]